VKAGHRLLALLPLAALVTAHSGQAGAWRSPRVRNAIDAPFKLCQAGAPPGLESPVDGGGLSIAYLLENTSAETLTEVGVEVVRVAAAGEIEGTVTYRGRVEIAPGVRTSNTYTLARVHVAPGDRLVILPAAARGRTLRWQISEAECRELLGAIQPEEGGGATAPAHGCFNPELCNECAVAGSRNRSARPRTARRTWCAASARAAPRGLSRQASEGAREAHRASLDSSQGSLLHRASRHASLGRNIRRNEGRREQRARCRPGSGGGRGGREGAPLVAGGAGERPALDRALRPAGPAGGRGVQPPGSNGPAGGGTKNVTPCEHRENNRNDRRALACGRHYAWRSVCGREKVRARRARI
jgi:hypothetical protein